MRAAFLTVVILAVAFSLFAAPLFNGVANAASGFAGWPIGPGFVAWALGLFAICLAALSFCRPGPEMTVASELVVVYGIFGLLFSISTGVLAALPALQAAQTDWSPAVLSPILARFANGLLSAGVAPLAAVVLRGIDTSRTTKHERNRSDELDQAYAQLRDSIDNARVSMSSAAEEFQATVGTITTAANDLAASLKKSAGTASGLEDVLGKLRTIGAALKHLQDNAESTATHMGGLNNRTHEAEQMLQALGEAIDKVSNFAIRYR